MLRANRHSPGRPDEKKKESRPFMTPGEYRASARLSR